MIKKGPFILVAISICLMIGACSQQPETSITGEFEVMKIGDYTVSGDDYQYWVLPYRTYYEETFGSDYWETSEGKKTGREILAHVNDFIIDWYSTLSYADNLGFELTPDQAAEVEASFQQDRTTQGDNFASFLSASYLTEANAYRLGYLEPARHDALLQHLLSDVAAFNLTPTEVEAYAKEQNFVGAYQIMIKNDPGEDTAVNLELAESVLEKSRSGQDFFALMEAYSESAVVETDLEGWTLSLDDESYAEYFRDALRDLKPDETSAVISYEDDWQSWYVIFKRVAPDLTVVKDTLVNQRINATLEDFSGGLPKQFCDGFDKIQIQDVVFIEKK